jgi:hypothetical protein
MSCAYQISPRQTQTLLIMIASFPFKDYQCQYCAYHHALFRITKREANLEDERQAEGTELSVHCLHRAGEERGKPPRKGLPRHAEFVRWRLHCIWFMRARR